MSEVGEVTEPRTDDLADPKRVGRKSTWEKIQARQEIDDLRLLLSTVEGRRFYWRLMAWTGFLEESFTGNNTTFYNLGRASVGRKMLEDLERVDPEFYVLMKKEANLRDAKET